MIELTRDELAYITCSIQFQLERDDGTAPPPLEAGESALVKMSRVENGGPRRFARRVIVFVWNTEHGECIDCGAPAAFYSPTMYGKNELPNAENSLCCVCAANHASDGETIQRIDGGIE